MDTAVRLQLRYGRKPGLPIVGIIIGDTPNSKRDEIKERFNNGDLNIVCMSDAGAEGINLQRSNRIVLLDVPVSPGRIEQIAGRVHRLGSIRAAQVTLLLPPGAFGTRVFETLRKAASIVYKQVVGSDVYPARPTANAECDPFYVRELAEYEARVLTAVAETSGVIRSEENRDVLEQVVLQPEKDGQPFTAPIEGVLKTGLYLIEEQRKRFQDASVATQSDLMPDMTDLVDALVKWEGAKVTEATETFRVPVSLVDDPKLPNQYGDLVTKGEHFRVLQLIADKQRYWFGLGRFLPSDVPSGPYQWLGVVGNQTVTSTLGRWRHDDLNLTDEQRFIPELWVTTGVPKGMAIAFCGVTNLFKRDGTPAGSPGERTLHVLIGFSDVSSSQAVFKWRPFYARGSTESRAIVTNDTWLADLLPQLGERWAANLIRRLTGLDPGYTTRNEDSASLKKLAEEMRRSVIKEIDDEDDGKSWRLQKEPVKLWLDANTPTWWGGGAKSSCRPEFFLAAFGEP